MLVLPLLLSLTLEHFVLSLDPYKAAFEATILSSAADRPFQCPASSNKVFKAHKFQGWRPVSSVCLNCPQPDVQNG